jgi:anti-anti-sigma factor
VDLQVRVALVGDTPTIALGGLVDLGSVPILQDVLTRAVLDHPGETIVVDLDGVVSFDDTALGLLLAAAGRARELGGELEIVCTSDRLLARLASTRFDRAVTVRTTDVGASDGG